MKTKRLTLFPLAQNDLGIFQEINVNPHVRKYLWDDAIMPQDFFENIMKRVDAHFKKDGWGLWKIMDHDNTIVMGYVGLWLFFDEHQPQLLYALHPDFTGKGYATE